VGIHPNSELLGLLPLPIRQFAPRQQVPAELIKHEAISGRGKVHVAEDEEAPVSRLGLMIGKMQ
jgi:hypothetical protein